MKFGSKCHAKKCVLQSCEKNAFSNLSVSRTLGSVQGRNKDSPRIQPLTAFTPLDLNFGIREFFVRCIT